MLHSSHSIIKVAAVAGVLFGTPLLTSCGDDTEPAPSRIAIVVDESLSFTPNRPAAAKIIQRYIKENAVSGSSQVYLIAMDRAPRVIGYYPAEQLLDKSGKAVLDKLGTPNPLDGTDVVGALSIAREKLDKDNGAPCGKRYLMVFSDMFADRQTHPIKRFKALSGFDWPSLRDASDASFYFVDPANEQTIASLMKANGVKGIAFDPAESGKLDVSARTDDGGDDD